MKKLVPDSEEVYSMLKIIQSEAIVRKSFLGAYTKDSLDEMYKKCLDYYNNNSYNDGFKWLEKAAKLGNVKAQVKFGNCIN